MTRQCTKVKKFIRLLWWRRAIVMLDKTGEYEEIIRVLDEKDADDKFARIRCPACKWKPEASSRWTCYDLYGTEHPSGGCLMEWNTFDTGGRCPGCAHRWLRTTCLRCHVHSLHEDWYEDQE